MNTYRLINALRDVLRADQDEREAREKYADGGGYEWGYYGFTYAKESRKAAEAFEQALSAIIDERVKAILSGSAAQEE